MSMNAVALRQAIRNGRNVPEGRLTLAETPLPLRACEEIVSHCSADVLVGRYSGQNPQRLPTWTSALRISSQPLRLNFLMCRETLDGKTTTFAWLTNFNPDRDNVIIIAQGGRKRWTIENEGFNEQKTGCELEHFCDCKDLEVMTCLYLLLQAAHLLMQLLARSDLIEPVPTLTFLAALLLEAWRNLPLSEELFDPQQPRFRIRFTRAPT